MRTLSLPSSPSAVIFSKGRKLAGNKYFVVSARHGPSGGVVLQAYCASDCTALFREVTEDEVCVCVLCERVCLTGCVCCVSVCCMCVCECVSLAG